MKLAHLILAHNNPQQLARLVKRLAHRDADIYISLDLKADISLYAPLKGIGGVSFIGKRVDVVWGEYSIIEATLIGLQQILAAGIAYSHINLLSGNDYPLKNATEIQSFLFAHADKTFMWYDRIFDDWVHGQARINTYYLGYYSFPGRYHVANLMNKVLPKRKLPDNLPAYGRSQWLTITPACAAYVINYIKNNKQIERFFKMTWAVDEVFFQTILCNSPLKDTLVNDNLRYLALQPNFRPVTYTMKDAKALTGPGKFYARKFDANVDSQILDYLDNKSEIQ
jgi:hypothetical protein